MMRGHDVADEAVHDLNAPREGAAADQDMHALELRSICLRPRCEELTRRTFVIEGRLPVVECEQPASAELHPGIEAGEQMLGERHVQAARHRGSQNLVGHDLYRQPVAPAGEPPRFVHCWPPRTRRILREIFKRQVAKRFTSHRRKSPIRQVYPRVVVVGSSGFNLHYLRSSNASQFDEWEEAHVDHFDRLLVLALGGGGYGYSRNQHFASWSPAGIILAILLVMYFTGNL